MFVCMQCGREKSRNSQFILCILTIILLRFSISDFVVKTPPVVGRVETSFHGSVIAEKQDTILHAAMTETE